MDPSVGGLGEVASSVSTALGTEIVAAEPVPGSVANRDFRLRLDNGRQAFVKIGPRNELIAEAWAIGTVAAAGVGVPTVLAYEDAPEITPIPFLVVDLLHSDGQLTPDVLHDVGRALKIVHTIEPDGYGPIEVVGDPRNPDSAVGRFADWAGFIGSITDGLDELIAAGLLPAEQAMLLRRRADRLGDSPLTGSTGVLLHADLKEIHLLAVGGRLTGIIDWGDVGVGDPVWDLARASMMDAGLYAGLVQAYPGADDHDVARRLPIYRALWNVRALSYEYRAGGDWFAAYQQRITADLDLL